MTARPNLIANTKNIWIIAYDKKDAELVLSVLPLLVNVEKASVFLQNKDDEVLDCLFTLPSVKELHLTIPFFELSDSHCAALSLRREDSSVTHLIPSQRENHPSFLAGDVLNLFPRMTHLAVYCHHPPPNSDWIEAWCNAAPGSLRVFVIITRQFDSDADLDGVRRAVDSLSHLSIVIFHVTGWTQFDRWCKSASMWEAANEAVLSYKTRTSESGDTPLIVVDALGIGNTPNSDYLTL
ncbi:hypothetical protein DL96DRAFT_1711465 [Flagelloscypha sp. PMI_526]|nr:hypothetical protein DL96DRAFT_1711465 [Flagelloscypha sp. PMI_526]